MKNVRPKRKSLTEQRAVNRPLTEYAQFVNQSEPNGRTVKCHRQDGGRYQIHPTPRTDSGLA
jgi:hypothetical protein